MDTGEAYDNPLQFFDQGGMDGNVILRIFDETEVADACNSDEKVGFEEMLPIDHQFPDYPDLPTMCFSFGDGTSYTFPILPPPVEIRPETKPIINDNQEWQEEPPIENSTETRKRRLSSESDVIVNVVDNKTDEEMDLDVKNLGFEFKFEIELPADDDEPMGENEKLHDEDSSSKRSNVSFDASTISDDSDDGESNSQIISPLADPFADPNQLRDGQLVFVPGLDGDGIQALGVILYPGMPLYVEQIKMEIFLPFFIARNTDYLEGAIPVVYIRFHEKSKYKKEAGRLWRFLQRDQIELAQFPSCGLTTSSLQNISH